MSLALERAGTKVPESFLFWMQGVRVVTTGQSMWVSKLLVWWSGSGVIKIIWVYSYKQVSPVGSDAGDLVTLLMA